MNGKNHTLNDLKESRLKRIKQNEVGKYFLY